MGFHKLNGFIAGGDVYTGGSIGSGMTVTHSLLLDF
jgi:hypothetical protein